MSGRSVPSKRVLVLQARARSHLWLPTPSERALWQLLRGGALGVHFRRQVVVGGFIVDFLAPSVKLIVEVDGGVHRERGVADARRERKLRRMGYRIVRVAAEVVLTEPAGAVAGVRRALGRG